MKEYKKIKVIKGTHKGCYGELIGENIIGEELTGTYRVIVLHSLYSYGLNLKKNEFMILDN